MGYNSSKIIKNLDNNILSYLYSEAGKAFNYKQIAAAISLKDPAGKQLVKDSLFRLSQKNKIAEAERGKYMVKRVANTIRGTIDFNKRGMAYLITEGEASDIKIEKNKTANALQADTVLAKVNRQKNGKLIAEVVEVIARNKTKFTGTIEVNKTNAFVRPDTTKIHVDFYIDLDDVNGAKHGEKVIVELSEWKAKEKSPRAKVEKVLGAAGETNTEIHAILEEYDLPYEFPQKVLDAADELEKEFTELLPEKNRLDIRDTLTFTIDPFDAKDFDDALSFKRLDENRVEVGIHIADVAYYLKPGSIIDQEAQERATSVYLVDRVVPMLPEVLSNGLCSLRPNEDKYCFSAIFEIDESGKILKEKFTRTLIHSNHRFTYEEAQAIIEGEEHQLSDAILTLDNLAKTLRKKRVHHGAIEFGSNETKFIMEDGVPTGVFEKSLKDSNKLIEEFMLLANKQVAKYIGLEKKSVNVYRIHDHPDDEKLRTFKNFIKNFGLKFEYRKGEAAAKALNKVLKQAEGKPYESVVRELAIRSMAKAEYSTENIGHYGLAFDYYSHFTSPIRRYPDVLVHRLLQSVLEGKKYQDEAELDGLCKHCSDREKTATDAERTSIKYMQVKYMSQFVGGEMYGYVSGLSKWGIYVSVDEHYCEGMVSLKSYKEDFLVFDEDRFQVRGKRSGMTIDYGDRVLIKVKQANLYLKQLDFDLIGVE